MNDTPEQLEAREARNILASAIRAVDGENSSSLVECARRAASIIAVSRIDESKLAARVDQLEIRLRYLKDLTLTFFQSAVERHDPDFAMRTSLVRAMRDSLVHGTLPDWWKEEEEAIAKQSVRCRNDAVHAITLDGRCIECAPKAAP